MYCGIRSYCFIFLYNMEHGITLTFYFILFRDEYKEFEKLIQEDLQEVDDRFEEEEVRIVI